jgi:hypothetical protein
MILVYSWNTLSIYSDKIHLYNVISRVIEIINFAWIQYLISTEGRRAKSEAKTGDFSNISCKWSKMEVG